MTNAQLKLIPILTWKKPCHRDECPILEKCNQEIKLAQDRLADREQVLNAKANWLELRSNLIQLEIMTAEIASHVYRAEQAYKISDRKFAMKWLLHEVKPAKERKPRTVNLKESDEESLVKAIKLMTPAQIMTLMAKMQASK